MFVSRKVQLFRHTLQIYGQRTLRYCCYQLLLSTCESYFPLKNRQIKFLEPYFPNFQLMDCNPGEICKEITDLPGEFLVNPKCLCPLEMSCPSLDPQNVETIIFDDHSIVHNVRCEMTSRVSKMRNLGELLAIPPEKRRMRIY